MKIGDIMVNAAYLGSKVLTAIAVGANKVWEGVSKYIKFKDPVVESLCMKWSSDGVGLTPEDAAKVKDIGTTFSQNNNIIHFNEFEKFTGVTSLGMNCFYNCKKLENITLPESLQNVSKNIFWGCANLKSIIIPNRLSSISETMFHDCINIESIVFGSESQVKSIGKRAFSNCVNLKDIILPPLVTELGGDAFSYCSNITLVVLTDDIPSLGDNCFVGCRALRWVNIPAKVTSLGKNCFAYCKSIENPLVIPSTILQIGENAFWECSSVPYFKFMSVVPPSITGPNAFNLTKSNIYVPDESVEAYKSATNWAAYADRIKPLSEYQPTNE
jgi:hypothetical protein